MTLTRKILTTTLFATLSASAMADCILDNTTSGWTGSISFHCDSPTNLYDNPINFDIDNDTKVIAAPWGVFNDDEYSQSGNTVSAMVKTWSNEPYVLPANQSVTMQFSTSSDTFSISNFHVGSVTPISQAKVSIILPTKPDFIQEDQKADVIIYKEGNKFIEINDQTWGNKVDVNIPLEDKNDVRITISVPALDNAQGVADPASFTLVNNQTQSVQISYKQMPVETGTLKITASSQGSTPQTHPHYEITTMDDVPVKEGDLDWKANFIDGLKASKAGVHYKLIANSFIEGSTEYKPQGKKQFIKEVSVETDKKTPAKIIYQGKIIPSEVVNISVSGLPKGAKTELSLTDGGDAPVKLILDHNGSDYPVLHILRNKLNWQAQATRIITEKGYYVAKVSPNTFKASKHAINLKISYKKDNPHYMVGYLNQYYGPWNQKVTISDAAKAGYNLVVIAFASGLSDAAPVATGIPNIEFYGNLFLAYTSSNTFNATSLQKMKQDIQLAKEKYGLKKILVSVGGATGGLNLDGKNLDNMAENIRYFLDYYNLDGIDFDLEGKIDPVLLKDLIVKIKQQSLANGQTAVVTAAPQLNRTDADKYSVSLVTAASNQDYKAAVEAGVFDMLFLQDYNTGEVSNRIDYGSSEYCNGVDGERTYCSEEMPGYISASFDYLTKNTPIKQSLINIPSQTLLVMGEPASQSAAGDDSVFYGWEPKEGETIYNQMAKVYASLSNQTQYGGAMVWSINHDFDNNCQFAQSIAPSVTAFYSSYCQSTGI